MKDYKQKIDTLIGNLRTEMQWHFDEVYEQVYKKGYAAGYDRGYEEGSIYCKEHCPHEAKIDKEPCEMTAEEYRQRMIQAFHNADTDELIAICVLPTEKEFEHLEWLLKNHYKNEPCGDAIDRKLVYAFLSGLISDETERKKALEYINELPSVNPIEPCSDAIDRAEAIKIADGYCHPANVAKELAKLPSVNPQPICEEREKGECPWYAG